MKYKNDFLKIFKNEMLEKLPNKNTRKCYICELEKAFSNQEFKSLDEFNYEKLMDYTKSIVSKKSASALKCSLKLFSESFNDFRFEENEKFFNDQVSQKSSRRITKWKPLKLNRVLKKINFISEDKKRLAYRTILATGLRVDELSNVRKKDIIFDNGNLYVFVEKGKYGKQRTSCAIDDPYLKKALTEYIKEYNDDDKLFYSAGHMKNIATKKGFMCHDLRRAYSKILLNDSLDKNIDKPKNEAYKEAIHDIKKQLGHEEKSTTYKKYLSRKIDFSQTKWQ